MGIAGELWQFLRARKKLWLAPIVVVALAMLTAPSSPFGEGYFFFLPPLEWLFRASRCG